MKPRKSRRHRPLRLETLEDRCVLSATLTDNVLLTTRGGDVHVVKLQDGQTVDDVRAVYQASADVLSVEPDYRVQISFLPNDPSFAQQYGLRNTGQNGGLVDADIDADQAWDVTTGTTRMTVAVIDTGIDYTHRDLYLNVWINQGEVPTNLGLVDTDGDGLITFYDLNHTANAGKVKHFNSNGYIDFQDVLNDPRWVNGVDNDGNGYKDDIVGWNFVKNNNNPFDDNGHGTHVAGIIGAMGNNGVGVSGVNHRVQLAALKFLAADGSGSTSAAIAALNYAVAKGIPISNNSWGGGGQSTALSTAINNARTAGHLFVAAAGNESRNNDVTPNYPSNYAHDNIIAVASTDNRDRLSSFSNFGATSVDLAAPGSAILSTIPGNKYASYNGTSMATPFVAGAAALVWGNEPSLTYAQVRARLLGSVDPIGGLAGKVATGGRLNVFKAISTGTTDSDGPRVVAAVPNSTTSPSSVRLTFSEPINPATFTLADITGFTGPAGAITATGIVAVAGSGNTQFDVTFAAQTRVGTYRFDVGPDIRDVAGNRMDQDQDGINGEAEDAFRVTFNVSSASTQTFTNATPVTIFNLSTAVSRITIGQDLNISDLNVRVNITHTYDQDLWIWLRGPDGTEVDLVIYRGGSGDNFTNTVFDDQAARSITEGVAPFSGSFRPDNSYAPETLSAYNGKNARGTWTLYVYDSHRLDSGRLNSWSLIITGSQTGLVRRRGEEAAADPQGQPATAVPAIFVTETGPVTAPRNEPTPGRPAETAPLGLAPPGRVATLDLLFSRAGRITPRPAHRAQLDFALDE